jgi:glycosyltransferase involved in cell wall biosynthesis
MTSGRRSIALVSRELAPLVGGGIAPVVRAAGELLAARGWDVTFVTDGRHRATWDQLRADHHPDAQTAARWVWVNAGDEYGGFTCWPHFWSARVDEALRGAYPHGAPDVIEFSDYLAEGFVTLQRRDTRDPWLDGTTVAVRVHTSSEMCSVLNGAISDVRADQALFQMERYCLRTADRLIAQGGDIEGTYRRFYEELAPFVTIRYAFPGVVTHQRSAYGALREAAQAQVRTPDQHLHLLFLGRTERRKGIVEIAEALCRRPDLPISIDIVGGDTDTGPLASSVRRHLELLADSDPRLKVRGPVPPHEVPTLIGAADAVLTPSRWECWPNVAFEAMLIGRPVVATPVGGLREIVSDGVTGLLAAGTSPEQLEALLEQAASDVEELRAMPSRAGFAAHVAELTDVEPIVAGYEALATLQPAPSVVPPRSADRRVAVIIPYFKLDATLERTLSSLANQAHRDLDVLVVNDGSLRTEDARLFAIADRYGARVLTVANGGLSSARNAGLRATTAPYVCMLDADDELDPQFIARALSGLERNPALAYVTSWVRYIDDESVPWADPDGTGGYFPFGNWTEMMQFTNLAGVCTSVIRRSALEREGITYDQRLASYEDWDLYRQLAERGHRGAVIPERWFHYRVRADSMTRQDAQPNLERLLSELRAAHRFRSVQWTPTTA